MESGVRYLEDGLLMGSRTSWAWVRVETENYQLQTASDRIVLREQHERALASLRGETCHLLVVGHPHQPADWASRLEAATPRPEPGFRAHLNQVTRYLEAAELRQREVYLGVKLGERSELGGLGRVLGLLDRLGGVTDPRPGQQLTSLRLRARAVEQKISAHVRARLASAEELRWLVRYPLWLGLEEQMPARWPSEPSRRRAWGGELLALQEGSVDVHRRHLELIQPEGRSWVTALAFARFPAPPAALPFPGGEWLFRQDVFPFPVLASLHFQVVPAHEAARHLGRKLAAAVDQAQHISEGNAEIPPDVWEVATGALELQHQITKDQEPLVYGWPRLLVAAESEAELNVRVTDLVETYRETGIDLVRPSGEQFRMWLESMPGDAGGGKASAEAGVRVNSYCQRQPIRTMAGAGYWATWRLGDGQGPVIATTRAWAERDSNRRIDQLVPGGAPVCCDPLLAALTDRSTGMSLTGAPGQGKTTLANYLAYLMRLRGATVAMVDPKREASTAALAALPGLGRVQEIDLNEEYEGVLDPFRLPVQDRDEAAQLAAELVRMLLPLRLAEEVEPALAPVATEEAKEPRPSLYGVVRRLWASDHARAREAADHLNAMTRWPLARLCFAREEVRHLDMQGALTVIRFSGTRLPLPARDKPPERYEATERLAVAVMHTVTGLVAGLLELPQEIPKAVVLDEAYVVTGTERGSAMVEVMARQGRSKNLAVLISTHSAADLVNERIRNCISQAMAFGSRDDQEVRAVLQLLGMPDEESNRRLIKGLESGECVYRDLEGRLGAITVDLVLPELREAFRTTPPRQQAPAAPLEVMAG